VYLVSLLVNVGWMKSGDSSGKTYKGTIEIPNLSEEHTPEEVDIMVSTGDSSACADTLKDFIRLKGAEKIREKLGQYIADLRRGEFCGCCREFNFVVYSVANVVIP